jgi:hypothetical protein
MTICSFAKYEKPVMFSIPRCSSVIGISFAKLKYLPQVSFAKFDNIAIQFRVLFIKMLKFFCSQNE